MQFQKKSSPTGNIKTFKKKTHKHVNLKFVSGWM